MQFHRQAKEVAFRQQCCRLISFWQKAWMRLLHIVSSKVLPHHEISMTCARTCNIPKITNICKQNWDRNLRFVKNTGHKSPLSEWWTCSSSTLTAHSFRRVIKSSETRQESCKKSLEHRDSTFCDNQSEYTSPQHEYNYERSVLTFKPSYKTA